MAFPDQPCPACPRVARGLPMPCRAMEAKHSRFCALAAEGNPGYIALLCDDSPPIASPVAAASPTIPVAESVRLLTLARACEHRDTAIPCGCSGLALCRLGKGKDGVVSLKDCCDCVAGREPD